MKLRSPTGEVHDVKEFGSVVSLRRTACGFWPSHLGARRVLKEMPESLKRKRGIYVWELVSDDTPTTCGRCKRVASAKAKKKS